MRKSTDKSRTSSAGNARPFYTVMLGLTILFGLASRHLPFHAPVWLAKYPGDILYATMVYWVARIVSPVGTGVGPATFSLVLCFCIEFLKFWHAPALDNFRNTHVGALILGRGFHSSNLVCYIVGVGLAVLIERRTVRSAFANQTS